MEVGQVSTYLNTLREKISHTLQESNHQDKFILASNVLTEISHHVPRLAMDPKYSKVLENLLQLLVDSSEDRENLEEKVDLCLGILTNIFIKSDFLKLAKDTFGSHVLQDSLNCLTVFSQLSPKFDHLLVLITDKIENECLFELLYHSSGSHVLRTVLMSLVNEVDRNEYSSKKVDFESLHVNKEGVAEWRQRKLFSWSKLFLKDLRNLLQNTQSSATYCLLINLLKLTDQLGKEDLLLTIIKEIMPLVTTYKNTSYLLQTCLSCSGNYEYTYVFNNLISTELKELCEDQFGNYVIQSFIENHHFQTSHLKFMIEGVNFMSLLNSQSSSIVWKLCKSCLDLSSCQEQFYKKLIIDLDIDDIKQLWFLVVSSGNNKDEIFLKPSGCSVLQYLVKFQKSIISDVTSSLRHFINFSVENAKFLQICCDVYFSRVLQNVFDVRLGLLPEKFIKKLFPTFQTNLIELSLDLNGCHVLHSYFTLLKSDDKVTLLSVLAEDYDKIKTRNPKFIRIINLSQFKSNRKLFQKKLEKTESVRELFKDIVKS